MAKFRKLSEEEVQTLMQKKTKGKGPSMREQIRQQYRDYLKELKSGDWAELELQEGEKKLTIRNRLLRAAKDLGVEIEFRRTRGPKIYFQLKK